jgi:phosphoribosylformylglycinamidine cyclo-ligase
LKIAFLMDRHDTVGQDLVAHCVNDILVLGAKPLFFLDYVATGHLAPEVVAAVVRGLARGCREAGCVLIAGETAEMPGFYHAGEYDVAGCIVGVVDRRDVIDGRTIQPGDILIGLASAGLHTNGYSLARKILLEQEGLTVHDRVAELDVTVGEELLKPHLCYRSPVERVRAVCPVKGLAHITGGGLVDNLPRILPEGTAAAIEKGSWPVRPIFAMLAARGQVPEADLFRTFNMGIGMVLVTAPEAAAAALDCLIASGTPAYQIGTVTEGERRVEIR